MCHTVQPCPTHLSRAIEFLYREYDVTAFWWELMEMLRKLLLVGIFGLIEPGSILQIAVGTIFSAVYLMVQLQASPYKNQVRRQRLKPASFAARR